MARRVRPLMEKRGHTSLFRCMVALWLASQSLAPGQRRTDSFRRWVETHEDTLFLPASKSRLQLKAFPLARHYAPTRWIIYKWLDGLVATFSDVILALIPPAAA